MAVGGIAESVGGGDALQFEVGGRGGVGAGELYLGVYLDAAGLTGGADEYGGGAPFHGTGIGIDGGIADNLAFALDGEADVLFSQAAHMAQVVGDFADHNDKVAAVGNEGLAHGVGIEA